MPAKERLLQAALELIREKGYSATTVDDLCEAAGVTKGAFFHHFESKEALGVAAADHWSAITGAFFEQAPYHAHEDPLDRVLGYVDFRREILRGEISEFTCLAGTMVQETYDASPAIREACRRSIFGHAAVIARDIQLAKDRYAPGASWSAESLALHMQAVIQGAFILAKSKHDAATAAECIAHLRRYVELLFDREGMNPKPVTKE